MNIEKLRELSIQRLKKVGVNDENYLVALQVERLKRKIYKLKQEIKKLKENAVYERDNFSAIDKREIMIEEAEHELYELGSTYETPVFCQEYFDVDFEQFNEFLSLTGIIGLLVDPNYKEIVKSHADEIGIPEFKEDAFLNQIHAACLPIDDIDSRILNVKNIPGKYNVEVIKSIVSNYINRLLDIIRVVPLDKYLELNKTFWSNEDVYAPECSEEKYDDDDNLYERMLVCYDKCICDKLLSAFVYEDFYETVNPGYSMIIMNVNKKLLLKEENGEITLEDPKKIFAYYIKKHNADELKYVEEEEDYEPVILSDFSDFTYMMTDSEFSIVDFNLPRNMVWEVDDWKSSDIDVNEEEIKKYSNVKVKEKMDE